MTGDEILEAVGSSGDLPEEVVIRALVAALCQVHHGDIDVAVAGLGLRLCVGSEGVAIVGCDHCFDEAPAPFAVKGV